VFEEAIRYPWKGEEKVETIVIGGLLSLFGFLLLPMFVVYGYLVRVMRQVSDGDVEAPPVFDECEELLVDGLKMFVVTLVYSLVPTAVLALAVLSWVVPVAVSDGSGTALSGAVGLLVGLVVLLGAVVISLAAAYLLPAAVAAFALTGRVGAAFSPTRLRSFGGHREYAVAWLVALVVTLLANFVAGAVSATVVGALLVPFVTFYGMVAAAYAIGDGVSDVPVVENDEETASVGQPAA
jgi:hypothetical protein